MIPRFDLYDFIANLIPGLVFLWCVQALAGSGTVRGLFHRFTQGTIQSFWRPLWM